LLSIASNSTAARFFASPVALAALHVHTSHV
jgi:hypothetical protein